MEAWTALSAVAAVTSKVELGTLVSPIGFRTPAVFAKMIATLDQISGGRVIVGLGAGVLIVLLLLTASDIARLALEQQASRDP